MDQGLPSPPIKDHKPAIPDDAMPPNRDAVAVTTGFVVMRLLKHRALAHPA
jgi:hypothetical protein